MTEGLKPCPFCGESKEYIVYNIEMEPDGITCPVCHIVVRFPHIKVKGGEKFEVAIGKMTDAWNRRAEE
ncbi:Lar family restriction alleviation protein [Bilifractor porci]|nr:Lar family restriction alleviation protein [Bilifractor porci]